MELPGLLVELTNTFYKKHFKSSKQAWTIQQADLMYYPSNSLGFQLHLFLHPLHLHLMSKFERHDVYHILTDYSTHPIDEIRMQFFLWGNGKKSLFQLGTIIVGSILLPEYFTSYIQAYRRGKNAYRFYNWDFQHLLKEDLVATKKLIFQKKADLKLFQHIHF
ncbi:MAG: hypothetical protein WCP57_09490 [Bacteroidota bacterium]